MSEFERSAQEREAARRERERRRAAAAQDTRAFDAAELTDAGFDGGLEDDEDAGELPAGTRRVSRSERHGLPGAPRGGQRRARAGRPPVRRRRERARVTPVRPRRRWARRLGALGLLAIAAVIAFAAWFLVQLYQPFGTSPHGRVTVVIPAHTGAAGIGTILADDKVVPSGFFFNLRAKLSGDRGKLLPGTYHLKQGMSYGAVLTVLTTPPPAVPTTEITMTPGERRVDFSDRLRAQGIKGDYFQATRHSPLLNPVSYGAPANTPSLEGFLFPDTYQLRVPVSISALIADQLRRFKQEFATVNTSVAAAHHLTPYDVLIIASLVQAEAFDSHDMALVASVIYNRLQDGMLLGFDSTTRYAVGNFTRPLTQSELASDSPWNTRKHAGLPPTPIDNPDLQAIQAAAHPPSTNDLYFVSKPCSNSLAFSATYSQFLNDVSAFDATQSQNGRPPQRPCKA